MGDEIKWAEAVSSITHDYLMLDRNEKPRLFGNIKQAMELYQPET